MSTTSIVLNGQTSPTTTAEFSPLPPTQPLLRSWSFPTTTFTHPKPKRPAYTKRQPSRDSPGWYNTEDVPTLDDFAKRLESKLSRLQQWQTRCAQNVVMALMRPTPVVLFLFNPITVLIWLMVAVWRYGS